MGPRKLMSVQDFENHVKQIVFSLYASGEEFGAGEIMENLYFTYKVTCDYTEVISVLEKLKLEEKLVCIVSREKYKVTPVKVS